MYLVVVVVQIYDLLLIIVIWPTDPGRVEYGVSLLTGDKYLVRAKGMQAFYGEGFPRHEEENRGRKEAI